jgi:magnesium chelatase family protein
VARYARRLSAPLVDRIDLVCQLDASTHLGPAESRPEDSASVRSRVVAAREIQRVRFAGSDVRTNAGMDARLTTTRIKLSAAAKRRLSGGASIAPLTARGYDRVLRVARTIADLAGRDSVRVEDLDEALGYKLTSPLAAVA